MSGGLSCSGGSNSFSFTTNDPSIILSVYGVLCASDYSSVVTLGEGVTANLTEIGAGPMSVGSGVTLNIFGSASYPVCPSSPSCSFPPFSLYAYLPLSCLLLICLQSFLNNITLLSPTYSPSQINIYAEGTTVLGMQNTLVADGILIVLFITLAFFFYFGYFYFFFFFFLLT